MRALAVLIPAVLISFLAGCTPLEWVKPGAAAEQTAYDEQACRQAAAREASFHSYQYHHRMQPIVVAPGQVVFPSGPYVDPHAEQFLHENRLAQFCMESKGYQLAPAAGAKK